MIGSYKSFDQDLYAGRSASAETGILEILAEMLLEEDRARIFANLQPWLIDIEACGSAHYWARKLSELGHTVRLMAPQFVRTPGCYGCC